MKSNLKKLLSLALLAVSTSTYATGEGASYLPEKGDMAISVEVTPLLRAIGGAYNNANDEIKLGGTTFVPKGYKAPDASVAFKYMLSNKWGINANLGIKYAYNNNRAYTQDDLNVFIDPMSEAKVIDEENVNELGASLKLGAEYRCGINRVQGVFGFGLLLAGYSYETNYSYGNNITELNQQPSHAYWPSVTIPSGYRATTVKSNKPMLTAGAYASAGVEWFVAPKISLGAEMDFYVYGTSGTQQYVKSEGYNTAYRKIEERTDLTSPGNRSLNIGTGNLGGSLYMTFYF